MNEEEGPLKLWRIFRSTWKLLERQVGLELGKLGLTLGDYNLLRALSEENEQTMSGLADKMDVSPAWITGLVDKLETSGFVKRVRSESDRRRVTISLEKAGVAICNQARKEIKKYLISRTTGMSGEQIAAIISSLAKMGEIVSKDE